LADSYSVRFELVRSNALRREALLLQQFLE